MDKPDTRGAGGRAPRGRAGSTPGKLMGLVASPLQILSKTVKGLVGSSPNNGIQQAGAAAPRPSPPPAQRQTRTSTHPSHKVEDGPGSFSFPTLPGTSDSPPANSLSRPAPAGLSSQPHEVVAEAAGKVTTAPLGLATPTYGAKDLMSGWSPSKLASLNFFMNGAKSGADISRVSEPGPATSYTVETSVTAELARPYFSLSSLLRSGPGGIVSRIGAPYGTGPMALNPATLNSTGGAPGPAASSRPGRYNPYGRPNIPKPPRPSAPLPPPLTAQPLAAAAGPPAGALSEPDGAQQTGEPKPSLAVATARLPPPNPRAAPAPSGMAPRPPTAPGAIRLAPGQVAFSSGRTGTPLPKFGPLAPAGQVQQQPGAHAPGGFRPLAGAVGGKRQRDSPAASPLMASGIRNLSEFKRRRQSAAQQSRSVLTGFQARTPREKTSMKPVGDRTPEAVGSGGSGAVTPEPPSGGGVAADVPATETARKILETLDNFKRTGDNMPSILAKPGAPTGARTGPSTGSPFPGPFMPPLDRLDQNHYGGTPTPSATTGAAGFICGATPTPSGVAASGVQTPGPRMVLDFKSPVGFQASNASLQTERAAGAPAASSDTGINALPLSPIAVSHVAADRSGNAGTALVSTSATEVPAANAAEMQIRADAAVPPAPSAAAAGPVVEPLMASVLQFAFSSPKAPSEPLLRRARDVCEANAAAALDSGASQVFIFAASSVGGDVVAPVDRPSPSSTTGARAGSQAASEVAKAAAVPLPDDEEVSGTPAEVPVASASVTPETQFQSQASKATLWGGAKRVAFAEQPTGEPADKQEADAFGKGTPAATAATPPSTPGGFFSSHAGCTPFRSFDADAAPAAAALEKMPAAVDKESSGVARPSLFAFGAAAAGATTAIPEADKPVGSLPFGQGAASGFSFGAPPKQLAPATDAGKGKAVPVVVADKAPADAEKAAPPSSLAFKPGPVVPDAAPAAPTPLFGQSAIGEPRPVNPASAPGFTFEAAPSAPSFGAAAAATPGSASTLATGTTAQASTPSFGVAVQSFGSCSAQATSSAPFTNFSGSTPSATLGAAPASAPVAAPVIGFTFGAPAGSAAVSSSAAPSASSAPAASGFAFGSAAPSTGPAVPPVSFGSPMPVQNPSSAPLFGAVQPSKPAGFTFSASSGPATSFTFGAPVNSGSSGGATAAGNGGFGAQQGSSNPAVFSFGQAASGPAFGASAPAPSFGAAPASQPAFGTGGPSFGAPAPANPFAAAAPSFAAPASQPVFGTAMAGTTPAFGASAAPTPQVPSFGAAAAPAPSFGGFGGSNGGATAGGMFTFGGAAPAPFGSTQPPQAATPAFGQGAPSFGIQAQPAQAPAFGVPSPAFGATAPAPAFGGFGAQPTFGGAPAADASGGFSLGAGDPKDGRKRVKARRHGH